MNTPVTIETINLNKEVLEYHNIRPVEHPLCQLCHPDDAEVWFSEERTSWVANNPPGMLEWFWMACITTHQYVPEIIMGLTGNW